MPVSYAPEPLVHDTVGYHTLFLAGSIEMGLAQDWQKDACRILGEAFQIYNPRRKDWDNKWNHDSAELYRQITWEQERIMSSDIVLFYFDPETKSPVTLLELGQCLEVDDKSIIVVCPDGFWKKTNVVLTCERYGVPVSNYLDKTLNDLFMVGMNRLITNTNRLNRLKDEYYNNQLVIEGRANFEQKSQLS
jgi:hypothetical protein